MALEGTACALAEQEARPLFAALGYDTAFEKALGVGLVLQNEAFCSEDHGWK